MSAAYRLASRDPDEIIAYFILNGRRHSNASIIGGLMYFILFELDFLQG
jgi:hypothetical protein